MRGFLVLALLGALSTTARAEVDNQHEVDRGMQLFADKGCLGCHSTDGTARVGPSFLGLFGQQVELAAGTATVDTDYLRRAIREPNADLRSGFPANTMPVIAVDDSELAAMVAAYRDLADPEVMRKRQRPEGSLWMVIVGALLFAVGHLVLSMHPLRDRLIQRLGANGFSGIYSLVALVGLVLLIWGWIRAPYVAVWTPPLWTRHIPLALMPLSLILLAGAFTIKSPTSVGQEKLLGGDYAPRGMLTVTRHPMLWGSLLWALVHAPPNGDVATLLLVASIGVLAIGGMIHIDRRRARAMGDDWDQFAAQTSLVPFAAVITGRTRLDGKGLLLPVAIGGVLYALLLFGHEMLIGVSALPY